MEKETPEKKTPAPRKPASPKPVGYSSILAWVIPSFIICGFMFSLGVLVGRNTAPVRFDVDSIEVELKNLQHRDEALKAEKEKMRLAAGSGKASSHDDILFRLRDKGELPEIYQQYVPPLLTPKYPKTPPTKEDLLLAENTGTDDIEEPVDEEAMAEGAEVAEDAEMAPIDLTEAGPPDLTPEPAAADMEAPPEDTKPEAVPAEIAINETPEPKTAGKFAIQVASLKDLGQAQMLMNKFKEKGYPAFFQSSNLNGQLWHRIRIGPYPDRETAIKDQARLKQGGVDCLVLSTQ